MEIYLKIFLLLAIICFATAIILGIGLFLCHLVEKRYDQSKSVIIERGNGKTRITQDKKGNVVKVEDIRNLEK